MTSKRHMTRTKRVEYPLRTQVIPIFSDCMKRKRKRAKQDKKGKLVQRTPVTGLYDIDDLVNTRFCSTGPDFRLCAAAPVVPFM